MENRLQEILDSRGIKKLWLAKQLEVNRNTITSLIKGAEPKLTLAYKTAEVLGLTVYDIWPR